MDSSKPSVFKYEDYREYLKDLYNYLKKESRYFSYRYFSKVAGFNSPNILKLVTDGDRNLSMKAIKKFSVGLKHDRTEAEFFLSLVCFNQAKNTSDRQKFAEEILKNKAFLKIHPVTQSQFKYYSNWYFIPIRELVAAPYFVEDSLWISKQLSPEISPKQVEEALTELCEMDLLKRDEGGQLVQSTPDVKAVDAVGSVFLAKFHREMLRLASESIDRFHSEQRELSSSTVMVSENNFLKLKKLIQKFRDDLVAITSEDPEPQIICQVGLQLFPLSKKQGAIK